MSFFRATLVATSLGVGSLYATPAFAASTVTLSPGANIQAAINSHPTGTAFILQDGEYRGQSVLPKSNDSFTGQGTVKLIGSTALSFRSFSSGQWVADATPINSTHGKCQATHPLCSYPQDLYIDNVPQTPVSSRTKVAAGTWYFDRGARKVYIGRDPHDHAVEIGVLPYAFFGAATGVTIKNIIVQRYANLAQFGAIGGTISGAHWTVSNVSVRYNHGTGVKLGPGSKLLNSFVHDNGELGINLNGANSQALNNEISYNNYAGYALGWEGGGSKFSGTTNLLLQGNYAHDNLGPGLWLDTENVGAIVENNVVTNNQTCGIQHELGYDITIHNNTVSGNGKAPVSWLWNGQISLQNSSNAKIYGNTITVPAGTGNGIAIINQNRGSGSRGTYIAANNKVYDNTITYLSSSGGSGLVNDTGSHPVNGNSFYDNHYILKTGNSSDKHWWWFGVENWSEFRADGEEAGGTVGSK